MNAFFPNHPVFVHFPVALLCAALLCELLAIRTRRAMLSEVARVALLLGTLGALAAVGTGLWGEGLTEGKPDSIERLSELHKNIALVVTGLAVVLSVWRIAVPKGLGAGMRNLYVIGLMVVAVLVLYSGHLGGQLVYDHGVGVTIGKRTFASTELPHESWPGRPHVEEHGRDGEHDRDRDEPRAPATAK